MLFHRLPVGMATTPLETWLRRTGPDLGFAALVDAVPDALVYVVDADRNLVFWSPGAAERLGYRAEAVVGAHCLKGVRCPECVAGCVFEREDVVDGALVTCHGADGRAHHFRKTGRALRAADGRFAGAVEVLHPVESLPVGGGELEDGVEEFAGMVTRDPLMRRAFQTIRNVAETDSTVLVRGESGTGKELVARAIHAGSQRRTKPFVAVNCASLSPTLLESELFGHVRGAFTGAVADRAGIFAQANGGTLLLDEVAELPMEVQARLLRVLQEQTFSPVGSNKTVRVDVRVVAATHKALREEARAGRFREDLMFRLRVVPIFLPPLRERRADVELLLHHFVARNNQRGPRRVQRFSPEAMRLLLDHRWPGNVREVQNVVDYAFAVGRGPEVQVDELPPEFREAATPVTGGEGGTADAVRDALRRADGHVGRAAELLGVSRPTFWRWRKRHGV